jgi:hypothetical protein
MKTTAPEEALLGGWVNTVVRVGDTVRRATGPWTPAVHALLDHLEAVGYPWSPRVLGFDEQGREVLTYIEGRPAAVPWPQALRRDEGLIALTHMLSEYHAAVANFVPPADAVWRPGAASPAEGEIVRHGDFAPWNTIWRGDLPVGVIDWDLAEPGPAIHDVAYAAWYSVPLHYEAEVNLGGPADLRRRLEVFCRAAGDYEPSAVLDALGVIQETEAGRLEKLGRAGVEPWATFVARGEVAWLSRCRGWLEQNWAALH